MSHRRHAPRNCARPQWFPLVGIIIFFLFNQLGLTIEARAETLPDAQESHPGIGMESRYAEAVIAYNRKQTQTALTILDELIAVAPKTMEYLELKALILKGLGEPGKSLDVYQRLYQVAAEKDRGPYAFELGTILQKQGKNDEAKKYFEKAIELNFNVAASHLYLGLAAYNANNFGEAEEHFNVTANAGIPDLELVGRYYLGITYFKLNNGPQGIQEIVDVQRISKKRSRSDLSKNISDAADKMLVPFTKGQWFGNMALLTQYDSNVQQLPTGAINPAAGANPSTLKLNFSGGGGYMTAPLNPFQLVGGYRASYNHNLNTATKAFQYFTNAVSLYLNYMTLSRTSGGLKVEGNYTFQNSLSISTDPTSPYEYLKYNSSISGGPYFRHQLTRIWRLDAELGIRKQTFFIDPNLSGTNYNGRVSIRNDGTQHFINPGVSLIYENNRTDGKDFYYTAFGFGLSNMMNIGNQLTVSQGLDFLSSNYSQSTTARSDKNISFKLGVSKVLNSKWALLGDVSYIKNISTVEASYSYNRFITSFGVGYTF